MPNFQSEELIQRAMAGYFRYVGGDQPSAADSTVEEIDTRVYVVLRNVRGPLAVYRLTSQDRLRRLKRWPKELDAEAA